MLSDTDYFYLRVKLFRNTMCDICVSLFLAVGKCPASKKGSACLTRRPKKLKMLMCPHKDTQEQNDRRQREKRKNGKTKEKTSSFRCLRYSSCLCCFHICFHLLGLCFSFLKLVVPFFLTHCLLQASTMRPRDDGNKLPMPEAHSNRTGGRATDFRTRHALPRLSVGAETQ